MKGQVIRSIVGEYERPISPLMDRRDTVLPDFIIYMGDKILFWEHEGMLDDPDHAERSTAKREWYRRNGYEPNVIYTSGPEDIKEKLHRLIEDYRSA